MAASFEITAEMIDAGAAFLADTGLFPDRWEKDHETLRWLAASLLATCLEHRAFSWNRGFPKSANCDSPCQEVDHGAKLFGGSSPAGC